MASTNLEKGISNDAHPARMIRDSSGLTAVASPAVVVAADEASHGQDEGVEAGSSDLDVYQTLVGIRFLERGGGVRPVTSARSGRQLNVLLDIFCPALARGGGGSAALQNRGLYERARSRDLRNRVLYTLSNYIIAGLYLLQILVAATLTALSGYARGTPPVALTVLGAGNTVLAGLLAWLTGQGMPVRFRRARDQWRAVVRAIEAAERTFAEIDRIHWPPGHRPDPLRECDRLERMYEDARLDQEANYPDTQNAPSASQTIQRLQAAQEKLARHDERKEGRRREVEALRQEVHELRARASET